MPLVRRTADRTVDRDTDTEAPPSVVTAVAIGTAPLPIIGVYAILFLVHGSIQPVQPPDVTSSKGGEFAVGWISLAVFIALTYALITFLNGRRRWPFALLELGILALCIDFASDDTVSGRSVSVLVAVLCVIALAFAFSPSAWRHTGGSIPVPVGRIYRWPARPAAGPAPRGVTGSTPPTPVATGILRRRRRAAAAGDEARETRDSRAGIG